VRGLGIKLALALLSAAGGCAVAKEATMDEEVFGKQERVYAGRFSLEVPAGAKRTGQAEIRSLFLKEVSFAEPLDKAFSAAWAAKLAEIEQLKTRRTRPYHIVGDVYSQQVLEPERFAVVLYRATDVKLAIQFAALRQVGAVGLWLVRPGELEKTKETLATIVPVGNAYHPRTAGAPPLKGDVFHLPNGAIALTYGGKERVSAIFKGGPLDVEIDLSTETTRNPKGGGLMARFGAAVANAGAAFAAGASPVRNRGRKAAGLSGEEFIMRDSEEGTLYCMWEFKGEADSGTRPRIQLQLVAPDKGKVTMAYWDALVDSLRPAAAP
jgi:hypothetical protein